MTTETKIIGPSMKVVKTVIKHVDGNPVAYSYTAPSSSSSSPNNAAAPVKAPTL